MVEIIQLDVSDPNSKRFVYSYRTSNTTYLRTFYPKFFHTTLTTGNFTDSLMVYTRTGSKQLCKLLVPLMMLKVV